MALFVGILLGVTVTAQEGDTKKPEWEMGKAPDGWELYQQGSGKAEVGRVSANAGSVRLVVPAGDTAGVKQTLPTEWNLYCMKAQVEGEHLQNDSAVGVFLNTADGALLKLEVVQPGGNRKARFTAMAGDKVFGKQETDLPDSGDYALFLIRRGDEFIARAGKLAEKVEETQVSVVASLKWPNLKLTGQAGVIATQPPGAAKAFSPVVWAVRVFTPEEYENSIKIRMRFNTDMAALRLKEAREVFGDRAEFCRLEAWIADRNGDNAGYIAAFKKVLAFEPDDPQALNNLGYAMLEDEGADTAEAVGYIEKADRLKPDTAYVVDSLAWGYYKLGRLDDAAREQKRALELGVGQEDGARHMVVAWEHLVEIHQAREDEAGVRDAHETFVACITKAVPEDDALYAQPCAAKAWCLYQLGRKEEAVKLAQRAKKEIEGGVYTEEDDTVNWERVADVLAETDGVTAMTIYKKALDNAKHFKQDEAAARIKEKIIKLL